MVLLARVKCIGNFRDFSKSSDGTSTPKATDVNEFMFSFTVQDKATNSIRITTFSEEALMYKDKLKVSISFL